MTAWDFLDRFVSVFPPIAATALFVGMLVVFTVGFGKHGFNFLRYGFKQLEIGSLGAKISEIKAEISDLRTEVKAEINGLRTEVDGLRSEFGSLRSDVDGLRTEVAMIKTNHFGHLKGFLTELTGILLDRDIINNTDKARLDNQLRDM